MHQGLSEPMLHAVADEVDRGPRNTDQPQSSQFGFEPRRFGFVLEYPRRCVQMSERVEIFERRWDDTHRGEDERFNLWVVMFEPGQDLVQPLSKRSTYAVEHHGLLCTGGGFPAMMELVTRLLDVRAYKGVVSAPLDAALTRGLLSPDQPIPLLFPCATLTFSVLARFTL